MFKYFRLNLFENITICFLLNLIPLAKSRFLMLSFFNKFKN